MQSVSITAENDFVLATSTFSQVPVPVPSTTRLFSCSLRCRFIQSLFRAVKKLHQTSKKTCLLFHYTRNILFKIIPRQVVQC